MWLRSRAIATKWVLLKMNNQKISILFSTNKLYHAGNSNKLKVLVSVSRYLQQNLETLSKSCNETMKITHPHHFQKLDIENRVIWLEIRTKILLGGANLSQGQGGFNSISRLSHGHRHYLLINVLSDNERSKVECFADILKPILVYKS